MNLKSLYQLDPDVVFLNHGSFGACPRPVFETYQHWQAELERQPVAFLGRRAPGLLAESRAALAAFLGVRAEDLVYFPNPTTALTVAARTLAASAPTARPALLRALQPGDEILGTDHEYGALERTWRFVGLKTGARYVQAPITLPVATPAAFIEQVWAGVNERTRVLFLSHITSPTALIFPVAELCRRARAAGILTIVDGAHAPGHIPLDLAQVGADIYAGACHKWLSAPKGAAFLYARPELQGWLEPLVVSWGWEPEHTTALPQAADAGHFVPWHEWQGTRDLAAYLTVPAAIRFQAEHGWPAIHAACHNLAVSAQERLAALTGLPPICPPAWLGQMCAARLPITAAEALKAQLYDDHRIEAPVLRWRDETLIRVSCAAYNDGQDIDALVTALRSLLPRHAR